MFLYFLYSLSYSSWDHQSERERERERGEKERERERDQSGFIGARVRMVLGEADIFLKNPSTFFFYQFGFIGHWSEWYFDFSKYVGFSAPPAALAPSPAVSSLHTPKADAAPASTPPQSAMANEEGGSEGQIFLKSPLW